MSRKIDLTKPLSASDRDYLLQLDRHDEVAYNAVVHGVDLPDDVAASIEARGITQEAVRKRAVAAGLLEDTEESTEESSAVSGAQGAGNEPSEPAGPEKFSDDWFEAAKVDDLKAELKARDLPVSGKRDELADRLYDYMVDKGEITDDETEEDGAEEDEDGNS